MKRISDNDKKLFAFIALATAIIIAGILLLINAMQDASDPDNIAFFKGFASLPVLARYIVVIITMGIGIMTFSNVSARFENASLRNGLTIGITAFAFVLTLPLVYVFIAIIPLSVRASRDGMPAVTDLGAMDRIMRTDNILRGFTDWFGTDAFLYVVFGFMLVLSLLFLLEPLVAGICVTKGKVLNVVGKNKNGKTRLFQIEELPVLKRLCEKEED